MSERLVQCVKLHRELPGLPETPFDHPLGERIYNEVSANAWEMWKEHLKMLINEFRLNPATEEAQEMILKQCESFLFGEGEDAPPPDYVPPTT